MLSRVPACAPLWRSQLLGLAQQLGPGNHSYATAEASSNLIDVKDDAQFNQVMKVIADANKLGVIDFTAKWCGPCKQIAPVYEKLSQRYPEVQFLKVDIDNPALADTVNNFMITGVPTFCFYKGPKKVESFSGSRPDFLENLIKKHIASE